MTHGIVNTNRVTYELARELLRYDSVSGLIYWRHMRNGVRDIDKPAGSRMEKGYISICVQGRAYRAHRLAWLLYYGYYPENHIDHRDRVRHHNWITNLREVTHVCNMSNRKTPVTNKTGIMGVQLRPDSKGRDKWVATLTKSGKRSNLGTFKDFRLAVEARWRAEVEYGVSGCNTTSSAYLYLTTLDSGDNLI
ncbi:HNH endonuclease [Candidatus Pacearchaeota archaeon]|nr:HNH endonuclease [Candidatus Pacearchaeota archaeon]